jgi:hypothetical protein
MGGVILQSILKSDSVEHTNSFDGSPVSTFNIEFLQQFNEPRVDAHICLEFDSSLSSLFQLFGLTFFDEVEMFKKEMHGDPRFNPLLDLLTFFLSIFQFLIEKRFDLRFECKIDV